LIPLIGALSIDFFVFLAYYSAFLENYNNPCPKPGMYALFLATKLLARTSKGLNIINSETMNADTIAIKHLRGICSVLLFLWQTNVVSADKRDDVNKGMRQYLWKDCDNTYTTIGHNYSSN
jgi:hypothetical protein